MTGVTAECERHGLPWGFSDDPLRPAFTVRCMHEGNRFVVEIHSMSSAFCAVDYVEDLAEGGVCVQTGSGNPDWERYTALLLAGVPPVGG